MKRVRRARVVVVFTLVVCVAPEQALARDYPLSEPLRATAELGLLVDTGEVSESDAAMLAALLQNPLRLNCASRLELIELPGVTASQADAIMAARPFDSVDDLQRIGMSLAQIDLLRPLIECNTEAPSATPARYAADTTMGSVWRLGTPPSGLLRLHAGDADGEAYDTGVLLTQRSAIDAAYDSDVARVVSRAADRPRLEQAYARLGGANWKLGLGSYSAGFGNRLVFDTGAGRRPRGWYTGDTTRIDVLRGAVRPRPTLFGAVASVQGDAWDATLFAATNARDLADHALCYHTQQPCDVSADCAEGYHCGADRTCHVHASLDAATGAPASRRQLRDVFRETLLGGNFAWHWGERTRIELSGYAARTRFIVANAASPAFTPAAGYPARDVFGAFGASLTRGQGPFDASLEAARGDNGATALVATGAVGLATWGEAGLALRYLPPHYDNPHNRVDAAPLRTLGMRGRNQLGAKLSWSAWPERGWRGQGFVNLWQPLARLRFDGSGAPRWQAHRGFGLTARQSFDFPLALHERVAAALRYRWRPGEGPRDGAPTLTASVSSTRLRATRLSGHASLSRRRQRAWLRAATKPWDGATIAAGLVARPYGATVAWQQQVTSAVSLRARYHVRQSSRQATAVEHGMQLFVDARLP